MHLPASVHLPFPEVEKVLCDLRWPLSLSEPLFPGLLSEHLELGVALPQPLVSTHCTSSLGWSSYLALSVPRQCLVSRVNIQLSLVKEAVNARLRKHPGLSYFPAFACATLCRMHQPQSNLWAPATVALPQSILTASEPEPSN